MIPKQAQLELSFYAGLLLAAVPADASPQQPARKRLDQEGELAACIRRSAGGKSWLEKTLWGLRDQEGGWAGAEIAKSDGSRDLGPLQVNSWWVSRLAKLTDRPENRVRRWLIHDTCFNVETARWIFLSGLAVTRDYWRAVGVYHSPTTWRQQRYARSVSRHLRRRFGEAAFASTSAWDARP